VSVAVAQWRRDVTGLRWWRHPVGFPRRGTRRIGGTSGARIIRCNSGTRIRSAIHQSAATACDPTITLRNKPLNQVQTLPVIRIFTVKDACAIGLFPKKNLQTKQSEKGRNGILNTVLKMS